MVNKDDIIKSLFSTLSPKDLWEIRIMSSADGDTALDPSILTTKKIRIYGLFTTTFTERQIQTGIAKDADAALSTIGSINTSSQIECNNIVYEIIQESKGELYGVSDCYFYTLKKVENTPHD